MKCIIISSKFYHIYNSDMVYVKGLIHCIIILLLLVLMFPFFLVFHLNGIRSCISLLQQVIWHKFKFKSRTFSAFEQKILLPCKLILLCGAACSFQHRLWPCLWGWCDVRMFKVQGNSHLLSIKSGIKSHITSQSHLSSPGFYCSAFLTWLFWPCTLLF